jgi:hypothetical protein
MIFTDRAPLYPSKCVITNLSNGEPMVDTGNHIQAPAYGDGIHVYVSKAGAEKVGAMFGLIPAEAHQAALDERDDAIAALANAAHENEELREFVDRVKWLESEAGFKTRQRAPRSDRGTRKPAETSATNESPITPIQITPAEPRKESQPA